VNHLKDQSSPYLLQHAGNPVDWYPWGEEAFAEARRRDKPVFLSIGYSTCHWCHVMERESFADPEVAALMNEAFVSIKVDREERPDIDQLYMTVCQLATGQGGWPLTIFMTPEQKPFFAATYIPKAARLGMAGLVELIPRVRELWATRRQEIDGSTAKFLQALRQAFAPAKAGELPGGEAIGQAYRELAERFDKANGGFGAAPKFPGPHTLMFLLRAWKRTGEAQALDMVERTLQAMRRGGIFDQVGFGFHRYATDARWNIPHYEKMLYDQALLALACLEAFQATGKALYRRTAEEVLTYLLRDLRSPEGAFYCAEDADSPIGLAGAESPIGLAGAGTPVGLAGAESEGEEGGFYIWTRIELAQALGLEGMAELEEAAALEKTPGGGLILTLKDAERPLPEPLRQRLLERRSTRPRPFRDDKVLSGWNGLAIAALARAGGVLERPDYTAAAAQAARFILERLRGSDRRLLHRYRAGEAGTPAFAEDYAYLAWGLLELYEAAFDSAWLREAFRLTDELLAEFWDGSPGGSGGLFLSAGGAESLIVRPRPSGDGALPGADSVALANLLKLGRIGDRRDYEQKAEELLRLAADLVRRYPSAYAHLLSGLDFLLGPSYEVVIAGAPGAADTDRLAGALRRAFLPNKIVILKEAGGAGGGEASEGQPGSELLRLAPFVRDYRAGPAGRALAYVCRGYACRLPTADPAEMLRLLAGGD
jgi:uncharacterized protein YyaL (SSP411 family)